MISRRPLSRHHRGRVQSSAAPIGALWLVTNKVDDSDLYVIAYSPSQLELTSYSGEPAIRWVVYYGGTGHGLAFTNDGSIIVATSEQLPDGNEGEAWVTVQRPNTRRGYIDASHSGVTRITVGEFVNWPVVPYGYGARDALQLPGGDVLLSRGGAMARLTLAQLYGQADHTTATCTALASPQILGWDSANLGTDLWFSSDGDTIAAIPQAATATGGSQNATKVMQGANIGTASPDGISRIAPHTDGGLYWFDWWTQELRYLNAAGIAALNSTPSNPAPTRTMTSSSLLNVYDFVLDASGGGWFVDYLETGSSMYYFSASQLATGGDQDPQKVFDVPLEWPVSPCFAPGYGMAR